MRSKFLVMTALVAIIGCQKEPSQLLNNHSSQLRTIPDLCDERDNQNSIFHGLLNPSDADDETMNGSLFYTALSLVHLSENSTYLAYIKNRGNYDSNDEMPLTDMMSLTGFDDDFDATISDVSYCNDPVINDYSELLDYMIYSEDQYYPVIYYFNAEHASAEDVFIIAVASEINSSDGIPGWILRNDDAPDETIVYESDSLDTIPIFIIANGTDVIGGDGEEVNVTYTDGSGRSGSRQSESAIIDNHQINFAYENDAHSEYSLAKLPRYSSSDGNQGDHFTIHSIYQNSIWSPPNR